MKHRRFNFNMPLFGLPAAVAVLLAAAAFLALTAAGCGETNPENGSWLYHPDKVTVFIKQTATPDQVSAMEGQIRAMPEVTDVTFVTKEEAKQQLNAEMEAQGLNPSVFAGVTPPPSFLIKVSEENAIGDVAGRFYENPLVDNNPGTHDAVVFGVRAGVTDSTLRMLDGAFLLNEDSTVLMKGTYTRTGEELVLVNDENQQRFKGRYLGDTIEDLMAGHWTRQ